MKTFFSFIWRNRRKEACRTFLRWLMLYFTASVYDVRKNDVPVAVGAEKCFCRILPNGKCFHLQKSWGRGWIFIKCCPPHFVKKTTDYNCKRVKSINPLFCKNFSPFKSRSCVKTVKICSKGCFYKKGNVFICQRYTDYRQSEPRRGVAGWKTAGKRTA